MQIAKVRQRDINATQRTADTRAAKVPVMVCFYFMRKIFDAPKKKGHKTRAGPGGAAGALEGPNPPWDPL